MSAERRSRLAHAVLVALWLGALGGCDRRVDPYVDRDAEPPASAEPVRIPGLERPEPGGRAGPFASMPMLRSSTRARGAPAADAIRGVVRVPPGTKAVGGTLFAIARSPGGGPPLAVRRWSVREFPTAFELGPGDVMLPGREFQGPLFLTVRLDADGDASTHSAGDLAASVDHPVAPGDSGIELTLVDEAAASAAGDSSTQATPASPSPGAGDSIEGTLRASESVAIPRGAVVFLIARSTAGGPPLAVRKLPPGPFPMAFRIGPEHTMIQGRPFHGPVQLSARLDEDGDAISRGARDASGEAAAPVEPGTSGVQILLRPSARP